MARRATVLLMVLAAVLGCAATANAQSSSSYQTGSVGGSDTTPNPGQTITVSGTGCGAGETVNFFLDGQPAGSTTADQNGNFSGPVTIPPNEPAGTHTITAECGTHVLGFEITVNPTAATSSLSRTGSSSTIPLSGVAFALLAVGGFLVLAARRRRTSSSP